MATIGSGSSVVEKEDLRPPEQIPVCTLFNDHPSGDSDPLSVNQIQNLPEGQPPKPVVVQTDVAGKQSILNTPAESVGQTAAAEPTLCNVFQTESVPSNLDDIFSNLGSEQNPEHSPELGTKASSMIAVPTMESLRLNHSVDSFDIGDLSENETSSVEAADSDAPKLADFAKPEYPVKHPMEDDLKVDAPANPLTPSQSFVSITSFSMSPEEADSEGLPGVTSQLASEVERLFIDTEVENQTTKQTNEVPPVSGHPLVQHPEPQAENVPVVSAGSQSMEFGGEVEDETETSAAPSNVIVPALVEENKVMDAPPTVSSLFTDDNNSDKSGLFPSPVAERKDMFTDEDDPFAAALSNSELDRRRDAWLPSETTRTVLLAVLANQKPIKLEPDRLTNPGLSTSELLEDPVKELVIRMTGSESVVKRENLTMDDVHHSSEGIKQLVDTGNLRSAANLCAKLLTDLGQGFGQATQTTTNTPETVQLWYSRISILVHLKLFEMAATELSPFKDLDNPDLYYEFYPDTYPGRRGSMVPFSFRLLQAEFPRHVDKPQESLKRLHRILAMCNKILENLGNGKNEVGEVMGLNSSDSDASVKQWTGRKTNTLFAIGNTLMQLKDYALAVDVYDRILTLQPTKTVELQSGIGRIFLHLGDVRAAQLRFTEAEKAGSDLEQYKVQLILNRGFMYIGTNNWKDAFAQFEQALQLEPHNIVALNNKAVCMLYLGQLKDAISVLEAGACDQNREEWRSKVTDVGWQQIMTQGLLGNLSTLYELESSRYVLKKRALFLKQIAPTCGDSFDTVCFKEI